MNTPNGREHSSDGPLPDGANGRPACEGDQPALVSVVIPTYNREQLLAEAIDSCLRQTYRQVEVVVVDDGSTDGTAAMLQRMAEQLPEGRLRYLTQKNQGPAAACNVGLEMSRGAYVKFLGSDDTIHVDAIEHYVAAIEAAGADLCIGSRQFVTLSGRAWKRRLEYEPPAGLVEQPLVKYFDVALRPQTGFWLFRRGVFDGGIRFDTTLLAREDTDLLARILVRGAKVAGAPGAVLNTRCHGGPRQGVRQYEPEVFGAVVDSNERLYELLKEHNQLEEAGRAFAGFLCRMVVRGWSIDRATAKRCYALARKVHPKPELILAPTWSPRARQMAQLAWRVGGPHLCAPLLALDERIRSIRSARHRRRQERKKRRQARAASV